MGAEIATDAEFCNIKWLKYDIGVVIHATAGIVGSVLLECA